VVLAILVAHAALRATSHHLALQRAGELNRSLIDIERWSGLPDPAKLGPCPDGPTTPGERRCRGVAVPRFLSPFQWLVIRHRQDGYELVDIDLLDRFDTRPTVKAPAGDEHWVGRALQARASRIFMSFARLPRAIVRENGDRITVQIQDLRFVREFIARPGRDDVGTGGPFNVIVHLDRQGTILFQRLGD
jgi:hypothetical protein